MSFRLASLKLVEAGRSECGVEESKILYITEISRLHIRYARDDNR